MIGAHHHPGGVRDDEPHEPDSASQRHRRASEQRDGHEQDSTQPVRRHSHACRGLITEEEQVQWAGLRQEIDESGPEQDRRQPELVPLRPAQCAEHPEERDARRLALFTDEDKHTGQGREQVAHRDSGQHKP